MHDALPKTTGKGKGILAMNQDNTWIDRKCAELMGWYEDRLLDFHNNLYWIDPRGDRPMYQIGDWHPSTNPTHCKQVTDKLIEQGWNFSVYYWHIENIWVAIFAMPPHLTEYRQYDKTEWRARCLASLATKEKS